ncbi:MAG: DUF885 domain-containing protein [Vicingaceae bacterium]
MKITILAAALLILFACDTKPSNSEEKNTEIVKNFDTFKVEFIDSLWSINPIWASYEGYHKFDELLPLPDEAQKQKKLKFSEQWIEKLQSIKLEKLSEVDKIDYFLIRDYLQSIGFYINDFKSDEWNPSNYILGGAFFQVINYKSNSIENRLKAIDKKIENVPAYYKQAKANLKNPTEVHTALAIQQLEGSKQVFSKTLLDSLAVSNLDENFKENFKQKNAKAIEAIEEFKNHLDSIVLPEAKQNGRSFRLGKELYEKKFNYQIQSAYSAEEIFKAAIEEKEKLHDNLYRLSGMLWEKYFGEKEKPGNRLQQIKLVINEVSKQHAHRDSFIVEIRNQIPQLEAFVQEKGLITLDPEKALIVRETPEYMRGIAGASISAPGPYDKNAETFYNVTPLDDYTAEEAESYLREYNDFTLQILNIHEAVPGHYTQLIYSNKSPSLIKSILGNGAMVEGWAVYTEKMMLENDYGGDFLEMGLMYYKWNLRTVCNTILDYGVHVLDFTEEEAMQLLMKEAFQEQSEAIGKWRRARLTQVQLCSYFTGYYEILQLRDEYKTIKGENYSLKEFHEEFLSYGSAPVKYIKKMMLGVTHSETVNEG